MNFHAVNHSNLLSALSILRQRQTSFHFLPTAVPHGPVLGPFLLWIYTTTTVGQISHSPYVCWAGFSGICCHQRSSLQYGSHAVLLFAAVWGLCTKCWSYEHQWNSMLLRMWGCNFYTNTRKEFGWFDVWGWAHPLTFFDLLVNLFCVNIKWGC